MTQPLHVGMMIKIIQKEAFTKSFFMNNDRESAKAEMMGLFALFIAMFLITVFDKC